MTPGKYIPNKQAQRLEYLLFDAEGNWGVLYHGVSFLHDTEAGAGQLGTVFEDGKGGLVSKELVRVEDFVNVTFSGMCSPLFLEHEQLEFEAAVRRRKLSLLVE